MASNSGMASDPAMGGGQQGNYGAMPPRSMRGEPRKTISPFIAEFLGTFVFVFAVGCSIITGDSSWNATGVASTLMVLSYSLAPVSGGLFNPAITLSLGLVRQLKWSVVFGYIAVQLLGGLLAGCVYSGLFRKSVVFGPKSVYTGWEVSTIEVIYTSMLCFVFLNVAVSRRNNPISDRNQYFGLAVAFVLIAAGYAAGDISGAVLNPAVSLGLDLTGYDKNCYWGFHYTFSQVIGAFVGAFFFRVVRPEEKHDMNVDEYIPKIQARIVSEGLGTFAIVVTYCLNVVTKQQATWWSTAAAVMSMVYSLGSVSGAHFNPAVTLSIVLSGRGKCKPGDGLVYGLIQIIAGITAGLYAASIRKNGPFARESMPPTPGTGYTWFMVFVAELIFTTVLCFVVLSVATATPPPSLTRQNFYYALSIGSCVTAAGYSIGAVSGGVINPAAAFGLSTAAAVSAADSGSPFSNCLALAFFELSGGVLASLFFALIRPEEFPRGKGLVLDI